MDGVGITAVPVIVVAVIAPGYLIQKVQHYSLIILRPPSKTELLLNAILHSLLVYILYFLLPWSRDTIDVAALLGSDAQKLKEAIISKNFLLAILWVAACTAIVGVPTTLLHYHRIPRRLLGWLGMRRNDEFLSAWEDFCEKSAKKWVELVLKDGTTIRGGLKSVSLPPDEPHVLMSYVDSGGQQYGVEVYDKHGTLLTNATVEMLLIKQKDIMFSRILALPPASSQIASSPPPMSLFVHGDDKRPKILFSLRVPLLFALLIARSSERIVVRLRPTRR